MTMGHRITARRESLGFSLSECARRARLKRQYLWQIEQGTLYNPGVQLIGRLASVLGTSVDALVTPPSEVASICDILGLSVRITRVNGQIAWELQGDDQQAIIFWPAARWAALGRTLLALTEEAPVRAPVS